MRTLTLLTALLLAGCGTTPKSDFYLLSARDAPEATVEGPIVWVGPVLLPDYLERPGIVTRSSNQRMLYAEFERWAEDIGRGFQRVLVLDLSAELPSTRVFEHAWEVPARADDAGVWRVTVSVLRFDCDMDGTARLDSRWTVGRVTGDEAPTMRGSALSRAVSGADTGARVRALSELIDDLAREIAAELQGRT